MMSATDNTSDAADGSSNVDLFGMPSAPFRDNIDDDDDDLEAPGGGSGGRGYSNIETQVDDDENDPAYNLGTQFVESYPTRRTRSYVKLFGVTVLFLVACTAAFTAGRNGNNGRLAKPPAKTTLEWVDGELEKVPVVAAEPVETKEETPVIEESEAAAGAVEEPVDVEPAPAPDNVPAPAPAPVPAAKENAAPAAVKEESKEDQQQQQKQQPAQEKPVIEESEAAAAAGAVEEPVVAEPASAPDVPAPAPVPAAKENAAPAAAKEQQQKQPAQDAAKESEAAASTAAAEVEEEVVTPNIATAKPTKKPTTKHPKHTAKPTLSPDEVSEEENNEPSEDTTDDDAVVTPTQDDVYSELEVVEEELEVVSEITTEVAEDEKDELVEEESELIEEAIEMEVLEGSLDLDEGMEEIEELQENEEAVAEGSSDIVQEEGEIEEVEAEEEAASASNNNLLRLPAEASTTIKKKDPDSKTGGALHLSVDGNEADQRISFIRFDLSTVPDDGVLESATLHLYLVDSKGGTEEENGTLVAVDALPHGGNWHEGTISWNEQPESKGKFHVKNFRALSVEGNEGEEQEQGTENEKRMYMVDVTSAIDPKSKLITFKLYTLSSNRLDFAGRTWHGGDAVPQLTVTLSK